MPLGETPAVPTTVSTGWPAAAPQTWSTRDVAPSVQFGHWRELICQAFLALTPESDLRDGFAGAVTQWPLGAFSIARITSQRQRVDRTERDLEGESPPGYYANLQLAGVSTMRQSGRVTVLRPGDVAVVDTTRPFTFEFGDDFRQLSFFVPGGLLRAQADGEITTATRIPTSTGVGAALRHLLTALPTAVPHPYPLTGPSAHTATRPDLIGITRPDWNGITRPDLIGIARPDRKQAERSGITRADLSAATDQGRSVAARLAPHAAALLAVALSAPPQGSPPRSSRRATRTHARAVADIEEHLADDDLSPSATARRLDISVRSVHALFAGTDLTYRATVRRLRLDRAARELRDPARAHLRVADIAADAGFSDVTVFHRAFRREFGTTPTRLRQDSAPPPG